MEIPFQVGVPVTGENFIDREELLEELSKSVMGIKKGIRQDFALISPRRMGKSSVMLALKDMIERDVIVVYIDCSKLYPGSLVNFLRKYSEEVYSAYSKRQGIKIKDTISKAVRGVGTAVLEVVQSFGADFGDIKLWLEFKEGRINEGELMDKVLELPERLAGEDMYFLIMLDEFQELSKFGKDFFNYLRGAITGHKRVDYIVSGSAVNMMKRIVHDRESPFYNLFVVKSPGNLPTSESKGFLKGKFKEFEFEEEAIDAILDITNGHPFYLQWLARATFIQALPKRKITARCVKDAYHHSLKEPSGHFEYEVARIKGRGRYFDILVVMAKYDLKTPTTIGRELNIRAGEVSPYLKNLVEMGFLKKNKGYEFVDVILKDWMKVTY